MAASQGGQPPIRGAVSFEGGAGFSSRGGAKGRRGAFFWRDQPFAFIFSGTMYQVTE